MSILDEIVANKRVEVSRRKGDLSLASVVASVSTAGPPRDFHAALLDSFRPRPRVIAEVKRRSPSRGLLCPHLDPAAVARTYEANGAAAISVLADSHFFGGSLQDLSTARRAVSLPVLCKEFVVDEYQIYEARAAGADALLLIAAILDESRLRQYRELCAALGMAALIEVHNLLELASALAAGADIIGINNRDLRTFRVSLETTRALVPSIPGHIVKVSESGIHTGVDRLMMSELGVDALLVGEGLIAASDMAAATREICGQPDRVVARR